MLSLEIFADCMKSQHRRVADQLGHTHRSMLIVNSVSIDAVQSMTSKETYTLHTMSPRGHVGPPPVTVIEALSGRTRHPSRRSETAKDTTKKFVVDRSFLVVTTVTQTKRFPPTVTTIIRQRTIAITAFSAVDLGMESSPSCFIVEDSLLVLSLETQQLLTEGRDSPLISFCVVHIFLVFAL